MSIRQATVSRSPAVVLPSGTGKRATWFAVAAISLSMSLIAAAPGGRAEGPAPENCTVIGMGRLATADGSVITSQSDSSSECRLQVIPGRTHAPGETVPVYWGMVHFGPADERAGRPLGDFGKIIGRIPQAERTYKYFHTGYPQMNEHQLAIGESTCSQRGELAVNWVEGVTTQIMTVEQAQVFALQRCRTAREAVALIGSLVVQYGFLPSCGGSEALCIADPKELWVQEIFSVGPDWKPSSGKPGAIWAARRVPDNHVTVVPNFVRIREIDAGSPDFMVSPNYRQEAIDRGWYDPKSGKPFIWQEAYAPPVVEGSLNRLWLFYSSVAPSLKAWPKRKLTGPAGPGTMSGQPIEGAAFYPFSVKPERRLSVQDVIAFQRSTFEGTVYDMTADPAWYVVGPDGTATKSPMATPFAPPELKKLLRISSHRTVAQQGYGMVAQLRSWLPDPVGGLYWFYVDNPAVSTHVPVYAGADDVSTYYKNYDIRSFSEDSARWAVDFVEKLLLLRWQDGFKDLEKAREPLESGFFAEQDSVDRKAAELLAQSPSDAHRYLTEVTVARMDRVVQMYKTLRNQLLSRYSGDPY